MLQKYYYASIMPDAPDIVSSSKLTGIIRQTLVLALKKYPFTLKFGY